MTTGVWLLWVLFAFLLGGTLGLILGVWAVAAAHEREHRAAELANDLMHGLPDDAQVVVVVDRPRPPGSEHHPSGGNGHR
jgi:hypothetical protein